MKEAAGIKAYHYDWLDNYLNYLLCRYLEEEKEIPAESFRRIQRRYRETENKEFRENLLKYYVKYMCVPGNTEAYETVYRFQTEEPETFDWVRNVLAEMRPEFLNAYYLDYYLNVHINSVQRCTEFLRDHTLLETAVAERIFQILTGLFRKEMTHAATNRERYEICRSFMEMCRVPGQTLPGWKEKFRKDVQEEYWKKFNEEEFSYALRREYEEMGMGKGEASVPDLVSRLVRAREDLLSRPDLRLFSQIFLSNHLIRDRKKREELREELRAEMKKRGDMELDACLLLNYRGEDGFRLKETAEDMRTCGLALYLREPEAGGGFIDSRILEEGSPALDQFKTQLQEACKGSGSSEFMEWIHVYQFYFPRRESSCGIEEYFQKWLFLLAMIPMNVLGCQCAFALSSTVGYAVSASASVLLITGAVIMLFFGEISMEELLEEYGKGVAILTAVFVIAAAALIVFVLLAPTMAGLIAAAVLTALLLVGQLGLLWKVLNA